MYETCTYAIIIKKILHVIMIKMCTKCVHKPNVHVHVQLPS